MWLFRESHLSLESATGAACPLHCSHYFCPVVWLYFYFGFPCKRMSQGKEAHTYVMLPRSTHHRLCTSQLIHMYTSTPVCLSCLSFILWEQSICTLGIPGRSYSLCMHFSTSLCMSKTRIAKHTHTTLQLPQPEFPGRRIRCLLGNLCTWQSYLFLFLIETHISEFRGLEIQCVCMC